MHLRDFSGDLYDAALDVAFLERLRGEMIYEDLDELVAQIARDVEQTRVIFEKFSPSATSLLG